MTDSPTSQAMHLAMTELKERAERVADLEVALECMLAVFQFTNETMAQYEAVQLARSVLNKETNRG